MRTDKEMHLFKNFYQEESEFHWTRAPGFRQFFLLAIKWSSLTSAECTVHEWILSDLIVRHCPWCIAASSSYFSHWCVKAVICTTCIIFLSVVWPLISVAHDQSRSGNNYSGSMLFAELNATTFIEIASLLLLLLQMPTLCLCRLWLIL